jgi:general secretion pathway protein J
MKKEGFTLIEALIAIALASLILSALYGTFFLTQKAVDRVDGSLIRLHEARMCLDIIGRELESALPGRPSSNPQDSGPIFKVLDRDIYGKQASGLTFIGFTPSMSGASLISYSVEEKDGSMSLIKNAAPAYKKETNGAKTEALEDIEEFSVEVKHGSDWVKTWDGKETGAIPGELRVGIKVKLGEKTLSLVRTIMPKIGKSI